MSDFLPDFRQIRAFVTIVQEGSFTVAAKKLNLTQSAISHSLRALEEQLDCRLLDRMGKKILPTREGEMLYKHASQIMEILAKAARECDAMKSNGQSRLRIGAPKSLCKYLIPHALREFRNSFPNCKISLVAEDTRVLLDQMNHHELDLVIGMAANDVGYETLFEDQLYFIVAPGHPWVGKEKISAEDMRHAPIISYSRTTLTHQLIEKCLREKQIELQQLIEIHDMEVIKEMARAGLGVGIVADWQAREECARGELQMVSLEALLGKPLTRTWTVYLPEGRLPSFVEEVFIGIMQMLAEHFRSDVCQEASV